MKFGVLLCLGVCFVQAQDTIKTNVPLVVLPASVKDRRGHEVTGLNTSDFLVLDSGHPVTPRVESSDGSLAPVALVIAVQTNDISAAVLAKIRKVGSTVAEALVGSNAEAAVVTFGDEVKLVQAFTNNPDAISEAFENLQPADSTDARMIDAVGESLKLLAGRAGGRRSSILIVGESRDRGSKTKLDDLVTAVERSTATIYSLTYSAFLTPFTAKPEDLPPPESGGLIRAITEPARLAKTNTVRALTTASGGEQFSFETKSKLENNLIRLGADIHNRYILSFTPEVANDKAGYHQLVISVKNRPNVLVRVRPGYWNRSSAR